MLNWILTEGHGTINKLCILYLSLKRDTCLTPLAIVKSHKTKWQIYFRVNTSPLTAVWWNATEMSIFEKIDTDPLDEKNDGF